MQKAIKTTALLFFILIANTLFGQIDQLNFEKPHCCTKKKAEKSGFCQKHGELNLDDKDSKDNFKLLEMFSFDVGVGPLEIDVQIIQDSSAVYMISLYSYEAVSREMNYSLYDEKGDIKEKSEFLQQSIDIDMTHFETGAYFLKIRNDLMGERIYKILKP